MAAERLAEWTPGVSMLRFTDTGSGAEHWLGRDPARGTWQSWDDPAVGYAGPRTDVLDAAGHLDPALLVGDTSPSSTLVDDVRDRRRCPGAVHDACGLAPGARPAQPP